MVRRLHPDLKRKVRASLAAISQDPHVGKSLRDDSKACAAFVSARFRVVYGIASQDRTVDIVAIGPRSRIYEETLRLIDRDSR